MLREKEVEMNMSVLRVVATGKLTEEESQAARIVQFVEMDWLKRRETKATLALLKAGELMRR